MKYYLLAKYFFAEDKAGDDTFSASGADTEADMDADTFADIGHASSGSRQTNKEAELLEDCQFCP